jgi:hypothetical protein
MGMGGFQSGEREDQKYATKSDPASEPARLELSPIDDSNPIGRGVIEI